MTNITPYTYTQMKHWIDRQASDCEGARYLTAAITEVGQLKNIVLAWQFRNITGQKCKYCDYPGAYVSAKYPDDVFCDGHKMGRE